MKEGYPGVDYGKLSAHVFNAFDRNSDGNITFDELLIFICISSTGAPEANLKFIFNVLDTNKDGSISKRELTKVIR